MLTIGFRVRSFVCACCIATFALCTGCDSSDKLQPQVASTPLALDPTDRFTLGEWWSDGVQLLHLRPDQRYTLYPGLSRYAPPVQRGRWDQLTYAAAQLQPYDVRNLPPIRVTIARELKPGEERTQGEIVLKPAGMGTFRALPAPPMVPEDALLGTWLSAEEAKLVLDASMRYSFTTPRGMGRVQHGGSWMLTPDGALMLTPDTAAGPSMRMTTRPAEDGSITLVDKADRVFARVSDT